MDRDDAHQLAAAAGRYYASIRRLKLRQCDQCGSHYQTIRIERGYCSQACRSKAYRLRKLEREFDERSLAIATRLARSRSSNSSGPSAQLAE